MYNMTTHMADMAEYYCMQYMEGGGGRGETHVVLVLHRALSL